MEFFDEVVLSLITIVFVLLVVKITSAAASGADGDRSRGPLRSIEVREEAKRQEQRYTVADLADEGSVMELHEPVKIVDDGDDELVEFALREAEKRSRMVDVAMEETMEKLVGAGKIGEGDDEMVKFDLQEDQVFDLVIEESMMKLDEAVKIGEDDDALVKFDLQEEEKREKIRSQEVDTVKAQSLMQLDEPVEICDVDAEFLKFDTQEEEKRRKIIDHVIEGSAKELVVPVTIANLLKFDLQEAANKEVREQAKIVENDAELVNFDLQEEENRQEKKSWLIDPVIEESYKLNKFGEHVTKLDKIGLQEEENGSQPINLTIEEPVKGFDETVKIVEDDDELITFDLQDDKYREELVKELHEPVKVDDDNADSLKEKAQLPEEVGKSEIGIGEESSIDEMEGTLLYGEDEWEGIEKSELEKLFGVAVGYVSSEHGGNALSKVGSDVKKQLYGLHKVATEGPCYEPQPLALKVTARAKWHSWQRLGNMNPEVAMEQYIAILSESIPGWMGENPGVDAKQEKGNDTPDKGASGKEVPDLCSFLHGQSASSGVQRAVKEPSCLEVDRPSSGPNLFAKGLTKTFLFDLLSPTRVTFL